MGLARFCENSDAHWTNECPNLSASTSYMYMSANVRCNHFNSPMSSWTWQFTYSTVPLSTAKKSTATSKWSLENALKILSYEFAVKDGEFTLNSKIASMSVTPFYTIGVSCLKEWLGFAPQLSPQLDYASLVFHKQLSRTMREIAVMSVKAIPACQEIYFF